MGIELGSNFDVKTALPLDSRLIVDDLTARDAIDGLIRYEGMIVYVISEATNFQLIGGVDNVNWRELSGSGAPYQYFLLDNDTADQEITDFVFDKDEVISFEASVTVYRETTGTGANIKSQRISLIGSWDGAQWNLIRGPETPGDCGVEFDIDPTSGQVEASSDDQEGDSDTSYIAWRIVDLVKRV